MQPPFAGDKYIFSPQKSSHTSQGAPLSGNKGANNKSSSSSQQISGNLVFNPLISQQQFFNKDHQ